MSPSTPVAVCLLAERDAPAVFRRYLGSVVSHTSLERIELRLAFSRATQSFHETLGATCPNCSFPEVDQLPGEIERFHWTARDGLRVLAWQSAAGVARDGLYRLLYHDVRLDGEFAITLHQDAFVEAGWWDALLPLRERRIDYIGLPAWHPYRAAEAERVATCPWYMGVPLARREGRPGVAFMRGGFVVVRSERLREANFPPPGSTGKLDVQLGEIAHQLGWTHAVHDQYVRLDHVSGV